MPDIAQVLRDEIKRLARKEVKAAFEPLKTQLRELKETIKTQEDNIQQLEKSLAKTGGNSSPPRKDESLDEESSRVRVNAASIKRHRLRLKLSQQQLGKLLEVSTNTIVRWEAGTSKPRTSHHEKFAQLRRTGVREVQKLLAI